MGILFQGNFGAPPGGGGDKLRAQKPSQQVVSNIVLTLSGLTPDQAHALFDAVSDQFKARGYDHRKTADGIHFPESYAVTGGLTYVLEQGSQASGDVEVQVKVNMGFGDMSRTGTFNDLTGIINNCAKQYIPK